MYCANLLGAQSSSKQDAGFRRNELLKAYDAVVFDAPIEFDKDAWTSAKGEFLLISAVPHSQPRRNDRFHRLGAIFVLVLVVSLATAKVASLFILSLAGAVVLVLAGWITFRQAGMAVDMDVILTIVLSFAVSTSLDSSGAAAELGSFVLKVFSKGGRMGILAGIYFATAILTNIITNYAAVAIMFPIIASPVSGIISQSNINPYAALYTLMLAGSASFCSPIGFQTNLMVHKAGRYKLLDWIIVGVPLQILCGVVTVLLAAAVWR
eukprot:Plantae.Rhodophyta-Purpureofilum_apyrenoidigerum.ctg35918.p1 GENE.Plantae.Rhodophyta-Purpureofilum_apyrenoidigerum.ctg35918~~Plantae.Rhodophyta-Purpureofilum_apyrenoidigerum.ctg35918.p1  ORF type:complete len:266 (-),score=36.51 Plantae.Rhodophyta-Purpureofilum_apyrenoidigerum.ctg35918:137-934(-)